MCAQSDHGIEGNESPRGLSLFRYRPGQGGVAPPAAFFDVSISGPLSPVPAALAGYPMKLPDGIKRRLKTV